MAEYIKREDAVKKIIANILYEEPPYTDSALAINRWVADQMEDVPSIDVVEVVRCKDCKHRPIIKDKQESAQGFNLDYPRCKEGWYDYECPCLCDDGFYNFYPADDWFCANGERKDETD